MNLCANWIDWFVFDGYLLTVFYFGIYLSLKEETSEDFFVWTASSLQVMNPSINIRAAH